MVSLEIEQIERVRKGIHERAEWRPDGPLWIEDGYGREERLTRRGDRGAQMLGMVMLALPIALVALLVGIQIGRHQSPQPELAPVERSWWWIRAALRTSCRCTGVTGACTSWC